MKAIVCYILIFMLASCSTKLPDKIIYYKTDMAFYKSHPEKEPLVTSRTPENMFEDLQKTGKELSATDRQTLSELLNNSINKSNISCGTTWKDGIFITYDGSGKIDKYIIVSLDCYDLIVYRNTKRLDFINLSKTGQKKLFQLMK